jgi:hypothetical protein
MLYRATALMIVTFWLTMTGLLLRKEFGPGDNSLRAVPLAHVAKMMFAREQASDLEIYSEKTAVGHLRLQPRTSKEDGQRKISVAGWLQLAIPGTARQRVAWTGECDLGDQWEMQHGTLTINLREPVGYTIELGLDVVARRLTIETRSGNALLKRTEYPMSEDGLRRWLQEEGLDPTLLNSLVSSSQAVSMEVKARQSSLELRGERVETYLVAAEQSGQTIFEAHVSQLGQILRVRTLLGYSAAPEDLTP